MNRYENQKEMSRAMNGKMLLMLLGIMQVFTGVTSTAQYGANLFMIAAEAVKGTEEYVNALAETGMSIMSVRVAGAAFIIVSIVEIFVGMNCIILQNRLDKSFFTRKLIFVLLGVEVVMNIFLFAVRLGNIGRLFSSLMMPLFLLWAVSMLCKLAKKYPDRVYALDTKQKKAQNSQPPKKKSLRERAMVPAEEAPAEEDEIRENVSGEAEGKEDILEEDTSGEVEGKENILEGDTSGEGTSIESEAKENKTE